MVVSYGSGGYGFGLVSDGRLFLTKVGASDVQASAATKVSDTNWHHVAVTKTGGTVVFYLDGAGETVGAYDPGFTFTTNLALGEAAGYGVNFYGDIDEVRILSAARSAAEIAQDARVTAEARAYRYVWDQNPGHSFAGGEAQWDSGRLTQTAGAGGAWYLHASGLNWAGLLGPSRDIGPFLYDATLPAASAFQYPWNTWGPFARISPSSAILIVVPASGRPTVPGFQASALLMDRVGLVSVRPYPSKILTPMPL